VLLNEVRISIISGFRKKRCAYHPEILGEMFFSSPVDTAFAKYARFGGP